ncbi:MAG: hypothetical protein ABSE81_07065 [Candidatus Omnitrophota bacterium]|jgi:hypothetical protein
MNKRRMRGQGTLEYVILTGFVVAALIAMGVYMKRGFQGRLRESTDQIGEQYSAQNTTTNYTTTTNTVQEDNLAAGGITTTTVSENTQTKTGSENVAALNTEQ